MGHHCSRDRGDEQALFQAGLNNAEECTTLPEEETLLMLHEERRSTTAAEGGLAPLSYYEPFFFSWLA
jgi:hypothetical protein